MVKISAIALLLCVAVQAAAEPISGLYNTGVDNSNALLGNGAVWFSIG